MKHLLYIILITLVFGIFSACSSDDKKVVVIPVTSEETESYDESVADAETVLLDGEESPDTLFTSKEKSEDGKIGGSDSSDIKIMRDGFGNTTATRFFRNHPLITGVVSKTSTDGTTITYVYGRDGKVKILPPELANLARTASGDQIAKQVGIDLPPKSADYADSTSAYNYEDEMFDSNGNQTNLLPKIKRPDADQIPTIQEPVKVKPEQRIAKINTGDPTFWEEFEKTEVKTNKVAKKDKRK